jgi:hypothetical protein
LDVHPKAQEMHELHQSIKTRYTLMRYELLTKGENDELFIFDTSTNYVEKISKIDYEK